MKVDWKSCVRIGISVFLLYLCVTYWPAFIDLLHNLLQAATPLLLGCVLAYAINILMSFYETHYFPQSANPALKKSRRPVCMLAAFLTLAVLLIFIVKLVIPELVSCIKLLAGQVPAAINDLLAWLETQNIVPETILASLQTVDWRAKTQQIIGFLTSGISSVMGVAVSAAVSVFSGAVTLLLAVIFSIYLLSGKEKLGNQFHRLMLRYVKPNIDAKMRYILSVLNDSFHKYCGPVHRSRHPGCALHRGYVGFKPSLCYYDGCRHCAYRSHSCGRRLHWRGRGNIYDPYGLAC